MPGGRAALPVGGGLVGVVVTVLILLLAAGAATTSTARSSSSPSQPATGGSTMDNAPDAESELVDFISFVVGDLQKFWAADFQRAGRDFAPTQLVLFRQATPRAAAPAPPRPGRSTARPTGRSTSTSASSASSRNRFGRRATSPRRT